MKMRATFLALLLVAELGGCVALPAAGPLAGAVEDEAGLREPYDAKGYVLVDVTPRVIAAIKAVSLAPLFPEGFVTDAPDAQPVLGVGDGITVSIWEAGAGGLFTSAPSGGFLPGARNVVMPEQMVAQDGSVSVPYAGRVRVAGLLLQQAEAAIRDRLVGKAIEPQVTVALTRGVSHTVSVMGEVGAGARVPLGTRGLTVMEAIATVGGIRIPASEAMVQLSRGGRTAEMSFLALRNNPAQNIQLAPGDVLTVVRQPKTITALGATGQNAIVPFATVSLTLEEAIAKAGGLRDERADPSGVYIFRYVPVALAADIAPQQISPAQAARDAQVPVVFRLDLGTVSAYFQARQFAMEDKDMVYVANARLTQVQKFLALINAVISPVITGVTLQNAAK